MAAQGRQEGQLQQLRALVQVLLRDQGLALEAERFESLTPEQAQEELAEDGYWGVEQTADRIFSFAIAAAGNDPARLETLKQAVQLGFDQARDALGGELPEISYRTLERVFERLDVWADERLEAR